MNFLSAILVASPKRGNNKGMKQSREKLPFLELFFLYLLKYDQLQSLQYFSGKYIIWIRVESEHILINIILCVGKTNKKTRSVSVFPVLDRDACLKNIVFLITK